MQDFAVCGEEGMRSLVHCLSLRTNGHHRRITYDFKCSFRTHAGVYVVDCKLVGPDRYQCKKTVHFVNYLDFCCNVVCY